MVRNNLLANYAAQIFVAAMAFAFIPIYIRFLGVEAYGVVGFFALLQAGMAVFDGFGPALNREVALSSREDDASRSPVRLVRSFEILGVFFFLLSLSAIFFSSSWLSSEWLNAVDVSVDSIRASIVLMGSVVSLRILEVVYRNVVLGLQRQVFLSVSSIFIALLRHGGAALVLVFYSASLEAFFSWQVLVSLVSVLVYGFFVYRVIPMRSAKWVLDVERLRGVGKFAGGTLVAAALAFLVGQLDKVLLSRYLGLEEFSYYAVAVALAGVISLLVAPVSQAAYPYLVANTESRSRVMVYRGFFQLVLLAVVPFSLVLIFFSEEILYAWSGNYLLAERSGFFLSLLSVGNLLSALMVLPFVMEYVAGRAGLAVKFNAFAVFFVFIALSFSIPRWGGVGAAGVWISLNVFYLIFIGSIVSARNRIEGVVAWFWRDIFFSLLAVFIVVLTVRALLLPLLQGRWLSVVVAFISWFLAVVVAVGVLSVIRSRCGLALKMLLHRG